MKHLHCFLVQLWLKQQLTSNGSDLEYYFPSDKEFNVSGSKFKFTNLCDVSDFLFQQLDTKFKLVFSTLGHVSASETGKVSELPSHSSSEGVVNEDLFLVLRCCMVVLDLLESYQKHVLEKCQYLLDVLKVSIFSARKRSMKNHIHLKEFSRELTYRDGVCITAVAEELFACLTFVEASDPFRPFLCAVLEVFMDGISIHRYLREKLVLVDFASSADRKLFTCHFNHGDIGSILEILCAHFILSVSDEHAYESFIRRLVWQVRKDYRIPELSLTPALSLLLNPALHTVPAMLQAHVISLVSDVIGAGIFSEYTTPDLKFMNYYLIAFERSTLLYIRHMSGLKLLGHNMEWQGSANQCTGTHPTFESYIRRSTSKNIKYILSKSESSFNSYKSEFLLKSKEDLLEESIKYMKDYKAIFPDSCMRRTVSILDRLIVRGFSDDLSTKTLYKPGDVSAQDIFLLTSILKLMSTSLVQAIWCFNNSGSSGCSKPLENASLSKKYESLMSKVNAFNQFNASLPVQNFVSDLLKHHQAQHENSKWIFLHFSGLLSLSFIHGLDFLVKGCISMLMAIMNLFIYEEGDLVALESLSGSGLQSCSHKSNDNVDGGAGYRKSSQKIAANFRMHQALHVCKRTNSSRNEEIKDVEAGSLGDVGDAMKDPTDSIEEVLDETCDGKIYLNCILDGRKPSDYDDLVDFIKCKQGRDYTTWLKGREKFQRWRYEKKAVLQFKRRRRAWKLKKG